MSSKYRNWLETPHFSSWLPSAAVSLCSSFFLSSCGGSDEAPKAAEPVVLVSQPQPPQTATDSYYTVQSDLLPNFTPYYSNFYGYGGGLLFSNTIVTSINNKPTIIFFIHKTQETVGPYVTSPVENFQLIFQRQENGSYADVTYQLLGNNPFKLNGQAGDAVAVTVPEYSNPIIMIGGNAEDGRAINTEGSTDTVVSQIQLPQLNGSYLTLDIGNPVFGGKGSMYVNNGNFYVGDFKRIDANWNSNESGSIGTYYQPFYQFDKNSMSFVEAGTAPTHAYGYEIIGNTMFTSVTHFASNTSGPSGHAFALANYTNSWNLANYVVPFETINHSFVTSGGTLTTLKDVNQYGYVINGVNVYGPLLSVQGQADLNGDGVPEIITGINANYVPALRADGRAYEADFKAYTKLQFWNIVDNTIVPANIQLNGEVNDLNQANLQILDVNNDNRLDIVINVWSDTGKPEVYLNKGSGNFDRADPSMFPSSPMSYSGSIFYDFNEDGILDLLYQPWGVKVNNNADQPVIYYGNKVIASASVYQEVAYNSVDEYNYIDLTGIWNPNLVEGYNVWG